MIFLLILPGAFAFESTEEAESLAYLTISMLAIFLTIFLLLSLLYRSQTASGLVQCVMFLQLGRWTVLMDYNYSSFYLAYWKQIADFFNPLDVFGTTDDVSEDMSKIGIQSFSFISNSEELLCVLAVCLIFVLLFIRNHRSVLLLQYAYLLTVTDIMLYALIQVYNLSFDSAEDIAGFSSACVFVLLYGVMIFLSFSFKREFKKEKAAWCYYPLVLTMRGQLMVLFVFASDSNLLQLFSVLVFELVILIYLTLEMPFEGKLQNLVAVLYHVVESLLIFTPISYELIDSSQIDNIFVLVIWLGLLIGGTRGIIDIFTNEKDSIQSKEIIDPKKNANPSNIISSHKEDFNKDTILKEERRFLEKRNISEVQAINESGLRVKSQAFQDYDVSPERNREKKRGSVMDIPKINEYTVIRKIEDP